MDLFDPLPRRLPEPDELPLVFRKVADSLAFHDLGSLTGRPGIAASWLSPKDFSRRIAGVLVGRDGRPEAFAGQVSDPRLATPEALRAACGHAVDLGGASFPMAAGPMAAGAPHAIRSQGLALDDPSKAVRTALMACCGLRVDQATFRLSLMDEVEDLVDLSFQSDADLGTDAVELAHRTGVERALAGLPLPEAFREAVALAREHDLHAPFALPLLMAGADRGRGLRDCARRHPLLARIGFQDAEARQALARGAGFAEALRAVLPELRPAHLRRLEGLRVDQVGYHQYHELDESCRIFLDILTRLPLDWVPPASGIEDCVQVVFAAMTMHEARLDALEVLAACKGDWAGLNRRLKAIVATAQPEADQMTGAAVHAEDIQDAAQALRTQLVTPLAAHEAVRRGILDEADVVRLHEDRQEGFLATVWWAAMKVMYAGKSATGVLEARNEWHRRQEAIDAAIFAASSTDLWPALFAPVRHGNVEVRPVTDGLSLREEGSHGPDRNGVAGMGHCVATRRPKLLRGEAHVLSIRRLLPDGGYERLSTAQVEVGPHGGIRLAEHKGPGNAEPPPEANAALQAVLAAAGQGVLKLNPEALERRGDAAGPDLVSFECQYDWRDPEAIATALRAWEPCLPRWLRGATPAEAFDLLRERGWLDDLAPDVGPSLPLP